MKKTILVVDDDEDIRISLKQIFEASGYLVVTVADGDEAVKKIASKKPNLILLDIMMPGLPAREIIRKSDKSSVIVITAMSMSQQEQDEILAIPNVKDVIKKPFSLKDLLKRVKKVV